MGNILDKIAFRIRQKDILIQIIVLNILVFLIVNLFNIITILFKVQSIDLLKYIAVPSSLPILYHRFWTVLTYMFVHENVLHIFFNMLLLYCFGQIFLNYFNQKNLGSLYILGGIAGAALYVIAFNTIPYYIDMKNSLMIGASASVMAIIFAATFYNPNFRVNLLLIGQVKILYIALIIFILDFISLGDRSNAGGHIAHIGGAILGYIYAKQYLKGKNIVNWLNKIIDAIVNIFKKKPKKMKVKYKRAETDYEYNEQKNKDSAEIDSILDKVLKSGYSSLTEKEKKRLFDASKK